MSGHDLRILHEDNHLLVVVKPAGLLAQGDSTGDVTLLDLCKADLKSRYGKPGNVYLGLVHRLDRPVSGVMVLARTSKAASRLSEQFRSAQVRKTYRAVVEGAPPADEGELIGHLAAEGDQDGRTRWSATPFPGSREACLLYRVLAAAAGKSLLEVRPQTGRRHQIRVQLAKAGCPVTGDMKYGAPSALPDRSVALHAWRLELAHPVGGGALVFTAPVPDSAPWSLFAGTRP
jgi:23S rRNA pseudouridine1911/1915/1917 synthase